MTKNSPEPRKANCRLIPSIPSYLCPSYNAAGALTWATAVALAGALFRQSSDLLHGRIGWEEFLTGARSTPECDRVPRPTGLVGRGPTEWTQAKTRVRSPLEASPPTETGSHVIPATWRGTTCSSNMSSNRRD